MVNSISLLFVLRSKLKIEDIKEANKALQVKKKLKENPHLRLDKVQKIVLIF